MTFATTVATTTAVPRRRRAENPHSPAYLSGLRRRAILLACAALLLLASYLVSADRTFGVGAGRLELRLTGSGLHVSQGPDSTWHAPSLSAFPFSYGYYRSYWRPYHVTEGNLHGVYIPLWQPLVLATGLAAYHWGLLRGAARHVDPLRCRGCGYSLIGLPETEGQRCPECGRAA